MSANVRCIGTSFFRLMDHGPCQKVRDECIYMPFLAKCPFREYFRRECEWIYRKEKAENDHKALLASISSPRNFFRAREPVPMNTHDIDLEKSARPAVTGSPSAIHSIRPLPADNVESSNAERRDINGLVAKPDIRIKPVDGMEFVRVPTMMRSPSQSNSVKRVRGGGMFLTKSVFFDY